VGSVSRRIAVLFAFAVARKIRLAYQHASLRGKTKMVHTLMAALMVALAIALAAVVNHFVGLSGFLKSTFGVTA
jgi:hypothetical protein